MRKNRTSVRLTDRQLQEHIEQSLETIRRLCAVYDEGHSYIAFTLTSEIHRFLVSGQRSLEIRGERRFPSLDREPPPLNAMTYHKLIMVGIRSESESPYVEFAPVIFDGPNPRCDLPFRDWWNRDIIFRTGPGGLTDPLLISMGDNSERLSLTRRTFIELVRNKLGAHLDSELPEVLDVLQRAVSLGIGMFTVHNGQTLRTADGTLSMKTGPVPAMVRHIAHEVITAFEAKADS